MLNGYAFKSEWFKAVGTRLLRNVNIGHGQADWSETAFIDEASAREFEQFTLKEGTLFYRLIGPLFRLG
ncbi:MAG: hypothetical protein IPK05_05265 [Comamonadaceae bacterium]|nr:hypothetical protein [Comamonadaceae bacterium]